MLQPDLGKNPTVSILRTDLRLKVMECCRNIYKSAAFWRNFFYFHIAFILLAMCDLSHHMTFTSNYILSDLKLFTARTTSGNAYNSFCRHLKFIKNLLSYNIAIITPTSTSNRVWLSCLEYWVLRFSSIA